RHRAQSSASILGPPAASPGVRHRGNLSCVPAARDWTGPALNAAFPTYGVRLPASRGWASNTAPALPTLVSNIAPSIPWLLEQEVEEVVMESTAQYWKPVWEALERYWKPIREKREGARRKSGTLHLAQAQSNRGRQGRKRDFPDAERLVKRLVARELTLSFVPDAEQRLWRTVTRKKYQLRCD